MALFRELSDHPSYIPLLCSIKASCMYSSEYIYTINYWVGLSDVATFVKRTSHLVNCQMILYSIMLPSATFYSMCLKSKDFRNCVEAKAYLSLRRSPIMAKLFVIILSKQVFYYRHQCIPELDAVIAKRIWVFTIYSRLSFISNGSSKTIDPTQQPLQ